MISYSHVLKCGVSAFALSLGVLGTAQAQTPSDIETVVVTGTSIRGASPIGSNLVTVSRDDIELTGAQTVQQLMSQVPGLTGFGGPGAGSGNSDQSYNFAPAIHNIGGGSSNATLVVIDGHRFPASGLTESQSDPTVIPTSALERVEILPNGASSVYGSDAVAGVLNYITRKDFTGAELNVQRGMADHFDTFTVSGLIGKAWNGGSVVLAADVSSQSNLLFSSRSYSTTRQDIRRGQISNPSLFTGANAGTAPSQTVVINGVRTVIPAATVTPASGPGTTVAGGVAIPALSDGVNYQDFNCPVATISPIGANVAYYYQPGGGYGGRPYYTATANLPSQGFCDGNNPTALIPSVTHNSALLEIRQELTDALTLDVHGIYGSRAVFNPMPRGTITGATVFGPDAAGGPGSNAKTIAAAAAGEVNPFYQGNAATGMATQLIRGYSLDGLLGPGGYAKQLQTNVFALVDATWDLGGGREITVGGTVGQNVNAQHVHGVVTAGGNLTATAAEVYLALDGTTNGSGIPGTIGSPDAFGLDTSYPVSRVLTSLNAIDVWNPPGPTNRTSAGVIESIKNSDTFINANQGLQDLVAKFDGPVYDLPAGAIKIAVGGEYMHATNDEYGTAATPAGPQITNSSGSYFREGRTILSAFLEVNAPIISEEMNVPLVQSFSMDISGRYDKYTDVGSTKNPKVGFDWVPFTGLKVRGSYGTSFVAPVLHDSQRFNTQSAIYAAGNFANPIIAFNDTRPFNGGAGIAGTWVSTAASCAAGNGTVVNAAGATVTPVGGVYQNAAGCKVNFGETNVAGITSAAFSVRGGNDSVHPATGRSDEIGFDADFGALVGFEGLSLSLTYWEVNYRGLLTNIQTMNNLPQLTSFAPIGGWTPTSPVIQEFISGRPLTIAMPTTIWATFDGRLQNAYNIWENGLDFGLNYFLHTDDLGTFRFGASGEQLLRYTTQGGNGPLVDTLGGKNSPRYPSAEMQARFTVGWAMDSFSATLAMNYQHPSHGTLSRYPYNLPGPDRGFLIGPESTAVYTSGGTYHVPGFEQFNLSMNYVLPNGFAGLPAMASDGVSLSLVIDNILDSKPPFSPASANGYVNGNPIGRQIMIGIKKLF